MHYASACDEPMTLMHVMGKNGMELPLREEIARQGQA